jgi:hypothetical protein
MLSAYSLVIHLAYLQAMWGYIQLVAAGGIRFGPAWPAVDNSTGLLADCEAIRHAPSRPKGNR